MLQDIGRGLDKKDAGLYLRPVTKAHLCWKAPLAALMRIKGALGPQLRAEGGLVGDGGEGGMVLSLSI